MASWAAIWVWWHYLWVINMASRLASGGINLAASSSSYHVSAAASPMWVIAARRNREQPKETKQRPAGRFNGVFLLHFLIIEIFLHFDFLRGFCMNDVKICWFFHSVQLWDHRRLSKERNQGEMFPGRPPVQMIQGLVLLCNCIVFIGSGSLEIQNLLSTDMLLLFLLTFYLK